jgi:hypothetical protein
MLAQVFMVFNPCTFWSTLYRAQTRSFLATYNVNYANWRKLEILNFINLMHVAFCECIFTQQKIRFGNTDIMNYTQVFCGVFF